MWKCGAIPIRSISFRRKVTRRKAGSGLYQSLQKAVTRLMLASTLLLPAPLFAIEEGERAFDFTLKSASGENLRLEEQRGKIILLIFWASDCTHCQRQLQALSSWHESYDQDGVEVWAISMDRDQDAAADQAQRWGLTHRILFDPEREVMRDYRISDVPTALLLDRDGRVQQTFTGFHPQDLTTYETSLLAILK